MISSSAQLIRLMVGSACLMCTTLGWASGAFNPSAPGPVNAQFTQGKNLVTGRTGEAQCVECHGMENKFKRGALKKLGTPISQKITNCESHTPCFNSSLSSQQLSAIDTYFKRRYRLK